MRNSILYCLAFLLSLATAEASNDFGSAALLKTYGEFKLDNEHNVIDMLTANDFELLKHSTTQVPTNCQIDSIYFSNSLRTNWALFRTVDLGYLKDIEMTLAISTDNVSQKINDMIKLISEKYPKAMVKKDPATGTYTIEYRLKDTWVVDDRWQNESYSPLNKVFTYRLTDFGSALLVEMNETVPKKTIHTMDVPEGKFKDVRISQR